MLGNVDLVLPLSMTLMIDKRVVQILIPREDVTLGMPNKADYLFSELWGTKGS